MKHEDRKAAIAAFKERKPIPGIYAVRCAETGEVWVGATPNLDKVQNRIRFTLRQGTNPQLSARPAWASLQAAWNVHGADDFSFEEVEILDEKEWAYGGRACLRERLAHWAEKLAARTI